MERGVVGDSNCNDWSMGGVGRKGRVVGDSNCFDWSMEGLVERVE